MNTEKFKKKLDYLTEGWTSCIVSDGQSALHSLDSTLTGLENLHKELENRYQQNPADVTTKKYVLDLWHQKNRLTQLREDLTATIGYWQNNAKK